MSDTQEFPHPSRIYDYFLGGSASLPVDRAAADGIVQLLPGGPLGARVNRRFLARAVRHATGRGIRQFLDLGCGIPTIMATHEVAPDARVVYVDNDPVVAAHAHRILGETSDGRTAFLAEDLRNAQAVLDAPQTKELIDFSQPVAVVLGAVLHFILDKEDPYAIVERYKEVLAPGSLLIFTHSSPDYVSAPVRAAVDELYVKLQVDLASRSREEIVRFVETPGWTAVAPGVVSANEWETAEEKADDADYQTNREDTAGFAAVALKS